MTMNSQIEQSIGQYMQDLGRRARAASRAMARADSATRNRALALIADAIEREAPALRAANELDLDAARANGLAPAMLDRLALSDKAITTMIEGLKGEGEALPLVLWAVSEEIRTLLKLKAGMAQGRPLGALLKENRIWGPRERMMEPALRRLSLATLEGALQQAAQVDKMVKGLRGKAFAGDQWDAMLQLALKVARG